MNNHLADYARKRCQELFGKVFGPNPKPLDCLAYFAWHRRLNQLGFGRDYSKHPLNPL